MFESLWKRAETPPPEEETGEILEWSCHPVMRNPWKSAAVSVLILIFAVLVWIGTESRMFTSLSIVILFLSLSKFYLPTGYKLTEKKVYVRTMTQTLTKDWKMYRTFYPDKNGVLLSTFAGPSRLENFRGLYLLFEDNRDQVVDYVRRRIIVSPEPTNSSKESLS